MKKIFAQILIIITVFTCLTGEAFGTVYEPNIRGSGAAVYCGTTNELIYGKNEDRKYDPASMTKLMTCYLAARELGLDTVVTVPEEATRVVKSESMVFPGEEITVRELIYKALLVSANDAAKTLAVATSGSEEKFVKLMNKQAKRWGMEKTTFKNSSGVTTKGHRASPLDVAIMASKVFYHNKEIRKIAGTSEYHSEVTNKSKSRVLKNTNYFLDGGTIHLSTGRLTINPYQGVFGGKTGTTRNWKTTMVVGVKIQGLDCYEVIMNSTLSKRYVDIKNLMDFARENVNGYKVFDKKTTFESGRVKGGAKNKITGIAETAGYINLPEGASASLVTTKAVYKKDLVAPIKKGQTVGYVEIYLADERVSKVKLKATEGIEEGWFLSSLGISNAQTIIIFAVILIVIGFFIFISILRLKQKRRKARAKRERLRQLARAELERERDLKQRGWPY